MTKPELSYKCRPHYQELPTKQKDEYKAKARELNAQVKQAENVGIGDFFTQLKSERKKPREEQKAEWQEDR